MHNWANPQKMKNELSVPSDRHHAYTLFKNLLDVQITPSTPPGGAEKTAYVKE